MLFGTRPFALKMFFFSSLLAVTSPCYAWGLSLDSKAKGLAHYIVAICHDLNGETPQAISEYQESVKFDALQSAPRLKLGAYYLRFDQISKATRQLKAVTRISSENTQAHYLLALIYSSEHKYDLAASEYESILKNAAHDDPGNSEVDMYLGQLYYDQQKYPQAMAAFRRVLQINPENSEALNSLAYIYAQEGSHLDEAIRMAQKAIAIDPANGAYYDSWGWALYKKGMYAQSLTVLQKAQAHIEDAILYDHIGDVFKALKEYALARHYWRKSLDLDSQQIVVQQKIKGIEKWIASRSSHRLN